MPTRHAEGGRLGLHGAPARPRAPKAPPPGASGSRAGRGWGQGPSPRLSNLDNLRVPHAAALAVLIPKGAGGCVSEGCGDTRCHRAVFRGRVRQRRPESGARGRSARPGGGCQCQAAAGGEVRGDRAGSSHRRSLGRARPGRPVTLSHLHTIPNPARGLSIPATHGPCPERGARALGPLGVQRAQTGAHNAPEMDQGNKRTPVSSPSGQGAGQGALLAPPRPAPGLGKACEGQTRPVRTPAAERPDGSPPGPGTAVPRRWRA